MEDRAGIRQEINDRAADTIAKVVAQEPELQKSVDSAVGYFVAGVSGVKLPIAGASSGLGVLHDTEAGTRTYMNVNRYDLGVGLGGGAYRVLILFQERDVLEEFKAGTWKTGIGVDSAAGTAGTAPISGASIHFLSEAGAVVTATARLINLSINNDLTDTGTSEISIPNTGFYEADSQGEDARECGTATCRFSLNKSSTGGTICHFLTESD